MVIRLIAGMALLLVSMGLGWWLHRRRLMSEARASQLVRWIVMWPSPVILCLSLWRMPLRSAQPWLLPLLGLIISSSSLLPAYWYATRAKLTRPQTGSFLTCAFFSNLGYLGAFVAFAVYGEAGYALCMLYLIFFTPCFYTLGFGIASRYGTAAARASSQSGSSGSGGLADAFNDKLRLYPFLGMLAGIALNFAGVHRPEWLEPVNHVLIPIATALYLIAIGSQLTFESPRPMLHHCLVMSGIKFLYLPLVAWALVSLFQIHGMPRIVVLLQASTPVGVSPLVLPLLFGLDRRLANAVWLVTTAVAIPWMLLILPVLRGL